MRFLVLASVLLVGAPSFAQAPPSAEASEEAKEAARVSFTQGMAAYEQGHFRAAIERFKEADRLAPSARLSFNVALCYERMSDAPNALAAYRDYLRRSPEATNLQETSVRIAELELELQKSGVQQLSVLSQPAGANVLIDELARGVTPWTGELPPGPHRVLLRARGYADTEESFELPARHAIDLSYQLEPIAQTPGAALPSAAAAVPPAPLATTVAPPSALPATVDEPSGVQWWTWAAFGGSAAALLTAGAFELSRRDLESDLQDPNHRQRATPGTYETMVSQQTTARVLLGAGLLLGAVGGVSLYFDLQRGGRAGVGFACAAGECGAFTRGYW